MRLHIVTVMHINRMVLKTVLWKFYQFIHNCQPSLEMTKIGETIVPRLHGKESLINFTLSKRANECLFLLLLTVIYSKYLLLGCEHYMGKSSKSIPSRGRLGPSQPPWLSFRTPTAKSVRRFLLKYYLFCRHALEESMRETARILIFVKKFPSVLPTFCTTQIH